MDPIIFIPSISLITLLILVYLIFCKKRKIEPSQKVMTNLGINAIQTITCLVLITGAVYEPLLKLISELKIYLFLFGIIMLINPVQSIYKILNVRREDGRYL